MYSYLYDSFLADPKYFRFLSSIETALTDLEINGRIFKLSLLNNSPKEIIKDEIKRGAKNIVVVGNDKLVGQVIDTLASYPKVALGIIPAGQPTEIAKTFGIPEAPEACRVLANRLIRQVNLAKINSQFFLYQAEVVTPGAVIRCDDQYRIVPQSDAVIKINNLPGESGEILQTTIQPKPTGLLVKRLVNASVFVSQRVFIEPHDNKKIRIIADDEKELAAPALIEITDLKLNVIVGKGVAISEA